MSTYTQLNYHIVFSTKKRNPCLLKSNREMLFRYIWGIFTRKKCKLYRINGVEDHLHILASVHPSQSISGLVRDIKTNSNTFIKEQNLFPGFKNWQDGYSAFTLHQNDTKRLIQYIKNQEEHHKKITYRDELRSLLIEHGVKFNESYLI